MDKASALRIGVIGAGDVAAWHADGLLAEPGAKLVAVSEQDPERLAAFAGKYGIEHKATDWRELIKEDGVDVLLILAPHHFHHMMVVAALNARKHVICEKPMARNVAECDAMLNEATRSGRSLFISHSLRNAFFYRTARRLIDDGHIGRPILGSIRWFTDDIARLSDPRHWKGTITAGGGVFIDGGCRVADVANGIFGPARRVAASGQRLVVGLPGRGEDNGTFLVEYASGATCSFSLSFTAGMAFRKEKSGAGLIVDIFGTEGHIEGGFLARDAHISHYCMEHHPGSDEIYYQPPDGQEDRVVDRDFVRAILDGAAPPLTAVDARNAVAVVESAYRSVRSGRIEDVDWRG